MNKELTNLDTKREQMTNQWINSSDYEREHLKDVVYLQEEQERIMQEINEEEHRLPAKVYIIEEKPKPEKNEFVERDTLPF